jgi:hypothetical protein
VRGTCSPDVHSQHATSHAAAARKPPRHEPVPNAKMRRLSAGGGRRELDGLRAATPQTATPVRGS